MSTTGCQQHTLERVVGRSGGVGTSRWGAPNQNSRFRLLKVPALGLFGPVVVAAEGGHVAFARAAALVPRGGVVQVAAGRGAAAAGRGAGGAASADQVDQGARGVVADLAVGVVAGTPGDRGQRGGQDARRAGGDGSGAGRVMAAWWSGARWSGARWSGARWSGARGAGAGRGVAAGEAAVGGGGAVGVQGGDAPPGSGVAGGGGGQVACVVAVEDPDPPASPGVSERPW